jgi:hypothetical protein
MGKEESHNTVIDDDDTDDENGPNPNTRTGKGKPRAKEASQIGHLAFEYKTDEQKEGRRAVQEPVMLRKFVQAEQLGEQPAPASELSLRAVANVEELDKKDEIPYASKQLALAGQQELEKEARDINPASTAGIGIEAASHFYALIGEYDGDSDVAYVEVMRLLGQDPDQIPAPDERDPDAAAAEFGPEQSDDLDMPDAFSEDEVPVDHTGERASADPPERGNGAPTSRVGARSSAGSGRPGGPGGGSGDAGRPGDGFDPDLAALPMAAANQVRSPDYDVGNPAVAALIGGIVGYLIGRRRGRIKTEKRLLPIQKKLRKEVTNLQWQLQAKETKIRQVAAEQTRAHGALVAERIRRAAEQRQADRSNAVQPSKQRTKLSGQGQLEAPTLASSSERQDNRAAKLAESAVSELSGAAALAVLSSEGRRPAPEAGQLHAGQPAPEQIGHMLLAAEATPAKSAEQQQKSASEFTRPAGRTAEKGTKAIEQPAVVKLAVGKHVETLNRAELLSMSERIVVDGSSLRQIYESHLISERGLRRLVAEHLGGGDLKKALRQEVVEREIDFERDPAMRDMAHQAAIPSGGGKTVLDNLLQKAASSLPAGEEEAAFFKARDHYAALQTQQHQKRRFIDIGLAAVIATLLALVLFLVLR